MKPTMRSNDQANLVSRWNWFWFSDADTQTVSALRVGVSIAAMIFVLDQWRTLPQLIGSFGILNQVDFSANSAPQQYFRLSPLYLIEADWLIHAYFAMTLSLLVSFMFGIGRRWIAFAAWLLVLGICNRAPSLQNLAGPLLCAALGYLIIDTGKHNLPFRAKFSDQEHRWTANLVLRLTQVHLIFWLVLSLTTQLAGFIWWRGEAVWFLAAAGRATWISLDWLQSQELLVNLATHTIVVTQAMAIVFLVTQWSNRLGFLSSVFFWLLIGLFAGEYQYAAIGIAMTFAFLGSSMLSHRSIEDSNSMLASAIRA